MPFAGLFWRFSNLAAIDALLRQWGEDDETESLRKARLGWWSACARIGSFVSLAVFTGVMMLPVPRGDDSQVVAAGAYSLLAWLCFFLTDIGLWGVFWLKLSHLVQGRPLVEPHASVEVTVGALPGEVREACLAWAADMRWIKSKEDGGSLSFRLSYLSVARRGAPKT